MALAGRFAMPITSSDICIAVTVIIRTLYIRKTVPQEDYVSRQSPFGLRSLCDGEISLDQQLPLAGC